MNEIFSDYFAQKKNYITGIDTRVKIFFAVAAIVIVLLSQNIYAPLTAFLFSLLLLLSVRIPFKNIFLRLLAPSGMALMILLVHIFFFGYQEGFDRGCLIAAKVVGTASVVTFLSMTTPVNKLLNAARFFKVSDTWVEITMMCYRYIFVLFEDAITIKDAQKVRLGYNGIKRSLRSLGELSGATVIRAYDRSLSVHDAMMLRGYGRRVINSEYAEKFKVKDMIASFIFCMILLLLWALK